TAAASIAASVSSNAGSISGAGADATNVVLTKSNAYISGSSVRARGAVTLNATSTGPTLFTLTGITTAALNEGSSATLTALRTAFTTNSSALASGDLALSTLKTDQAWKLVDSDRVIYFI